MLIRRLCYQLAFYFASSDVHLFVNNVHFDCECGVRQALACTIHCKTHMRAKMPFAINYELSALHCTAHLCKYGLDSVSLPHISFNSDCHCPMHALGHFAPFRSSVNAPKSQFAAHLFGSRLDWAYVIESWCMHFS